MNKNKLFYTFDLDGTLVDDKLQPKAGVIEMFDKIQEKSPNAIFTIASGARIDQIEDAVQNINAGLKNGHIKFNVVANNGSYIRATSGGQLSQGLSAGKVFDMVSEIKKISSNATIVYRTNLQDYISGPRNPIQAGKHALLDKIGSKFGVTPMEISDFDIEKFIRKNEVMSIFVIVLNPKNKKKVFAKLNEMTGGTPIHIGSGTVIEVSNFGKKQALTKLFGEKAFSKMVYVGDGKNDIPMLETAKLSFAVGKKLKVLKSADYAITDFAQLTDFVFEGKELAQVSNARIQELEASFLKRKVAKIIKKRKKLSPVSSKQNHQEQDRVQ